MDRVKLADEMKRKEKEFEDFKQKNPNSELIPILMKELKEEREANNERMDKMWDTMQEQMDLTRDMMRKTDIGAICTIQ